MNKKLLKGFVVGLVGLVIMVILISLLIPSKVIITRAVVVHAQPEKISAYLTDLHQWKRWHPVFMQDSNSIKLSIQNNNKLISWQQKGKENNLKVLQIEPGLIKFSLES